MPSKHQDVLRKKYFRTVSAASDMSTISMESTVSEFLEKKSQVFASDLDYYRVYQDGLRHALSTEKLSSQDYQKEMYELDENYKLVLDELRVLKKQRRTLEQDFEDAYDYQKHRKLSHEPNIEFMERAYAATMISRVMAASSKQKKRHFDQSKFRRDVVTYLDAARDPAGHGRLWCHLSGWHPEKAIKAAHLVPKSLRGDELAFLFGVGEVVLSNPKNGKSRTTLESPAYG
jgi:hypothetical protein